MSETMEINGKQYAVTGYAEDGLPIIKAKSETIHHTDEAGNQIYDEHGNPKISVNVTVPPIEIGITPGEVA